MRQIAFCLILASHALTACDDEPFNESALYAPCESNIDCAYEIDCITSPYGGGGLCTIPCTPEEESLPNQCHAAPECEIGCCLTVAYDFVEFAPAGGTCIPFPLESHELSGFFAPCESDYDCMPGLWDSPYWGGCFLNNYLPHAVCTTGCEAIHAGPTDLLVGTCLEAQMCPVTGCCMIEEEDPDREFYYRGTCVPDSVATFPAN
jgi:hypothetical protein